MSIHIDSNIGVNSCKTYWMRSKDGKLHWCRRAVSIMGGFNSSMEYLLKTSPFEPGFQDNFIEGKGTTKEEAQNAMDQEEKELCNSLWSF